MRPPTCLPRSPPCAASPTRWWWPTVAAATAHANWPNGLVHASAARTFMASQPNRAGYFQFALDIDDHRARRLERLVAWRCRKFALPYGDQGLLLSRKLLEAVGGINPLPLMEDVELVRRVGRQRLVGLKVAAM